MARKYSVPKNYTHFAILKSNNKIITGWNYKGLDIEDIKYYANGDLEDMDYKPKDCRILSAKYLISRGINPYEWKNWDSFVDNTDNKVMGTKKKTKKPVRKIAVTKKAKKTTAKKTTTRQTGTSNKEYDKRVQAKPTGKRTSKSGNTYYEYRANRTDRGKLLGVSEKKSDKIILKRLKEIGAKSKSPLEKKVVSIIAKQYVGGGYNSVLGFLEDILYGGLQSGIISELIYYSDTIAFYKKYKKEINDMLKQSISDFGAKSPSDLFGNKWDSDDIFAEDSQNQNLLSWFAFEEITRNLENELNY